MPAKRKEKIGTRRLTRRALQSAWRDSVNNTGDFPTPAEWKKLEAFGRAVEHHSTVLNQREVSRLLTGFADGMKAPGSDWIRVAMSKLKRRWTLPNAK